MTENKRDTETEQLIMEMGFEDGSEQFFTEFGEINGPGTIAILKDQSTLHVVTKFDI
jgi:hypothetical protein